MMKQKTQETLHAPVHHNLRLPTPAFQALVAELSGFSSADTDGMSLLIKNDLLSRCMTGPDSVSVSTTALKNVQTKLERATGFGAQAMMHSAGRALSTTLSPKLMSDSGNTLQAMGFGMRALEVKETGMVVYADTYGLDYLFLGILEGLVSKATKKETKGETPEPGVFSVTLL